MFQAKDKTSGKKKNNNLTKWREVIYLIKSSVMDKKMLTELRRMEKDKNFNKNLKYVYERINQSWRIQ